MRGSTTIFAAMTIVGVVLAPSAAFAVDPLVAEIGGCTGTVPESELSADPSDFALIVPTLGPGDRLSLSSGQYSSRLQAHGLHGEANHCIIIEGPTNGSAVFVAQSWMVTGSRLQT